MEVIELLFDDESIEVENGKRILDERKKKKNMMTRQLSEKDLTREAIWVRRQKQMMSRRNRSTLSSVDHSTRVSTGGELPSESTVDPVDVPCGGSELGRVRSITDEDLDDLEGSIDLGFRFDEENGGHELCKTLPALDLYFAINRSSKRMNYSSSSGSTPTTGTTPSSSLSPPSTSTTIGTPSPRSSCCSDSWQLVQPGDTPEHIKTKLRHWARVVACNMKQQQAEIRDQRSRE